MIRLVLRLILATICLAQQGCSYETRSPQRSVAIYVNENDGAVVRTVVEKYAKSHGYSEKKGTSIEDDLNKRGIILWSFHSANRSFISLTNAVVVDCYDLGVYSTNNAVGARKVLQEITQILDRAPKSWRIDFSGAPCSEK